MARAARGFVFRTLLILTSSLVLTACGDDPQPAATPPPAVSVYTVGNEMVGDYREFVARTAASRQVDIRARVEGEITEINFTEGTYVEQGQLLFAIDDKPYTAALEQAKADLAARRADASQAADDFRRAEELAPRGFISQSDLGKLRSAAQQTQAAVAGAEAALQQAQLNLDYTRIAAPFDGQIGKWRYDLGTLVNPGSEPLATLQAIDPIFVNFQVEESAYINYLQQQAAAGESPNSPNMDLTLKLPNGEPYNQPGNLNFADTRIDSTVGSVNIRAEFANPDGLVLPGLYVTLAVESRDKTEAPLIPQAAVQQSQLGYFVLAVDDQQQVKQQVVTLGRRLGAMWVVDSGLDAGQQIIIEGLQKVRPGVAVAPVEKSVDPQTGAIMDVEAGSPQAQ